MNYYQDHVKLTVGTATYLYRKLIFLQKALEEDQVRSNPLMLLSDVAIKEGVFIKERYAGYVRANQACERYGITPDQYLTLNDRERNKLLE